MSNRRLAKHDHRAIKRAEAQARQAVRNQRTQDEQLDVLRARGAGDCDEAWKIRSDRVNLGDPIKPKAKKVAAKS
jgi:hypothetical protein